MVQNGLDVNQKRNMSVAPLSIAAEKGNLRMVSLLVQAGAKVSLIPLYCQHVHVHTHTRSWRL